MKSTVDEAARPARTPNQSLASLLISFSIVWPGSSLTMTAVATPPVRTVKAALFACGTLTKKITLTGIGATAGAKAAIEAAGGTVA